MPTIALLLLAAGPVVHLSVGGSRMPAVAIWAHHGSIDGLPDSPVVVHSPFAAGPHSDLYSRAAILGTGATYYVSPRGSDTNGCTVSSPCRTVQGAEGLVGPGDTIELANGTYPGFNWSTLNGTMGYPITLWSPWSNASIFDATCYIENCDNMYVVESSWLVFDGLKSLDSPRAGIRLDRSANITVRNCIFGNDTRSGPNAANLFTDITTNLTIEYNDIFGAVGSHGIYLSAGYDGDGYAGYRTQYGDLIRHNVIYDNNWTGVQIAGGINETVLPCRAFSS